MSKVNVVIPDMRKYPWYRDDVKGDPTPINPRMNRRLLKKLYLWARDNPQEWDQSTYGTKTVNGNGTACGTAYCLAGETVITAVPNGEILWSGTLAKNSETGDIFRCITGVRLKNQPGREYGSVHTVHTVAMVRLGLTRQEADDLFNGDNTLEDIRRILVRWGVKFEEGE